MKPLTSIVTTLAPEIERNVSAALQEDIGDGDLTAQLTRDDKRSRGTVISRETAVIAGIAWFQSCFRHLDANSLIHWTCQDGDNVDAGQVLCEIDANTRALLTAERPALNFLQTLSATATLTQRYVQAVTGTSAHIVDTRKTLPGLRLAQKYAVRCGGGHNHRLGLYDGILIKENHIMAAGSISEALQRARAIQKMAICHHAFIEIEVETLAQLDEALNNGAEMVLLDNMDLAQMREAVRINQGRATLEASGGINLDTVRAIAETGVNRISIGALTKDVRAIDLSLRHVEG
jgi:nicotinate-nucleotide pyrophosphorylase (carboxylating)